MKESKNILSNKEEKKARPAETLFSNRRKPIINSYNGYENTQRFLRRSSPLFARGKVNDLSTFINGSYLDPYFKNLGDNRGNAAALSQALYASNRIYQSIIDYLINMYYWRTVTIPRNMSKVDKQDTKNYLNQYHKMLEVADGFNAKVFYPLILKNLFIKGQVYLYAFEDVASKTVAMILLPNEYCTSTVQTQYGTTQILFDFSFFDVLAPSDEDKRQVFQLFPKEFETLYQLYKTNNSEKWIPLNPKVSTSFALNEYGFPTLLSMFYDIIDYKTYKLNELDRSTNALERLVTHEIDLEKTGLELPEVQELHDDLAAIINGNGTTLVTSVGKLEVQQIQEELSHENKALSNAYKSIYDNAGFNNALFSGGNADSLKVSIKRDMNFVWTYVEQIVNFYNLAANNLFKFGTYQLSFRVLPISPYDEKEKLELYKASATLGVGVIDFMVASGTPQIDIESTLQLEESLDLVSRLKPLQSSHTQSLTDEKDPQKTKEENDNQVKKEENENDSIEIDKVEDSNKE